MLSSSTSGTPLELGPTAAACSHCPLPTIQTLPLTLLPSGLLTPSQENEQSKSSTAFLRRLLFAAPSKSDAPQLPAPCRGARYTARHLAVSG